MLEYEPTKRLSLAAALRHPFFQSTVSSADQNAGKSWEGNRDISRWQYSCSTNVTVLCQKNSRTLMPRVNMELNWHWFKFYSARGMKPLHSIWFLNHLPIMWEQLCAAGENEELGASRRSQSTDMLVHVGLSEIRWVNLPYQVQFFQPIVANDSHKRRESGLMGEKH